MHLYVHVPFCARRCSYCDFSIAVRPRTPIDEYNAALDRELSLKVRGNSSGALDTVYFGGGTPSRLGGAGIATALTLIRNSARIAPKAEITIEANPDDVRPVTVAQWVAAGVNRVSLGAQSFDDAVLRWMHRTHDARAIPRAFEILRGAGIDNISLDLIFSVPAHLGRSWARDLEMSLSLNPSHVSLYGLTIEPRTPVGRWKSRGLVVEGTEEVYEQEFLESDRVLVAAGYEHYEVSNFARAGLRSRHNSSYWSGAPYIGLGPSAHSFDGTTRSWNVSAYVEWNRRLLSGQDVVDASEVLTTENRNAEEIYLGLRTSKGLALRSNEAIIVKPWIDSGWATLDGAATLRLTALGWLRLDALAPHLAAHRGRRSAPALSATPSHCYI